jgi:hypothetical protein
MASFVRSSAFAVSIALAPGAAAQSTAASSSAAPLATPPSTAESAAGADSSAPAAAAQPRSVAAATGYSYGAPKSPSVAPLPERAPMRSVRPNSGGPDALMTGFETLDDGSTRLFVELTKAVTYDTKPGRATVTYVLKGAHVDRRNNQNPLVTVHFNTPVASARLVPHGRDVWFVVDLRANVQPTVAMDTSKEGTTLLRVAFAKGDYLPPPPAVSKPEQAAATEKQRASAPPAAP